MITLVLMVIPMSLLKVRVFLNNFFLFFNFRWFKLSKFILSFLDLEYLHHFMLLHFIRLLIFPKCSRIQALSASLSPRSGCSRSPVRSFGRRSACPTCASHSSITSSSRSRLLRARESRQSTATCRPCNSASRSRY